LNRVCPCVWSISLKSRLGGGAPGGGLVGRDFFGPNKLFGEKGSFPISWNFPGSGGYFVPGKKNKGVGRGPKKIFWEKKKKMSVGGGNWRPGGFPNKTPKGPGKKRGARAGPLQKFLPGMGNPPTKGLHPLFKNKGGGARFPSFFSRLGAPGLKKKPKRGPDFISKPGAWLNRMKKGRLPKGKTPGQKIDLRRPNKLSHTRGGRGPPPQKKTARGGGPKTVPGRGDKKKKTKQTTKKKGARFFFHRGGPFWAGNQKRRGGVAPRFRKGRRGGGKK